MPGVFCACALEVGRLHMRGRPCVGPGLRRLIRKGEAAAPVASTPRPAFGALGCA